MKKSELKNGMIVEYFNGDRRLVLNDRIIGVNGYAFLEKYDEDLKNHNTHFLNIEKVYISNDCLIINDIFNGENLTLIWQRKKTKKVFRMWNFLEVNMNNGYDETVLEAFKSGWVQSSDGLTKEEMENNGLVCEDSWLVEE